jgi:hypothetical protein
MNTRITIVTPTYNQGGTIEQTIDSVLSQAYPALEYIVIDGGSTDNTVDILKRYDKHICYWESKSDRGQAHALNKGFSRASGEVYAYINSDDYYEPEAFDTIDSIYSESSFDLCYGKCNFVNENGEYLYTHQGDISNLYELLDLWQVWWKKRQIIQPEVFWSANAHKRTQGFNEKLFYGMDYQLWTQIFSQQPKIRKVDKVLCNFRVTPVQKTANRDAVAEELLDIVNEQLHKLETVTLTNKQKNRLLHELDYSRVLLPLLAGPTAKDGKLRKFISLLGQFKRRPKMMTNPILWDRVLRNTFRS